MCFVSEIKITKMGVRLRQGTKGSLVTLGLAWFTVSRPKFTEKISELLQTISLDTILQHQ